MTHFLRAALGVALVVASAWPVAAQQPQQPAAPAPAPVPAAQTPPAPAPGGAAVPVAPAVPGTVTCPLPVPPATLPARSFTARTGLLMHQVIPARAADFDRFLAYVRDALAKTTNPTLREQAKGWSTWRAVEAGPNGDLLYVFVLNPAVPCVDYALMPIIADAYPDPDPNPNPGSDAYPDPAQLTEIYKLYTSSVRPTGTTLVTLVPGPVVPLTPPVTPPTTPPATGTVPGAAPAAGTTTPATQVPGTTTTPATGTQKPLPVPAKP